MTSRYEDPDVRLRCKILRIKLLPKSLAGFVPVNVEQVKQIFDWVLIDDDELVHMTWKMSASTNNKSFIGFRSYEEFQVQQNIFDQQSNIFIDSNLGSGIRGEDVAKQIFASGFCNLYLATGYSPDQFAPMAFIKAVIGKEPPL